MTTHGVIVRLPGGLDDVFDDERETWHTYVVREGGHLEIVRVDRSEDGARQIQTVVTTYAPGGWLRVTPTRRSAFRPPAEGAWSQPG